MVIMPIFSSARWGSAPETPAGAPPGDPAGLPPWTHNFCTFASCPRPPSLLQLWEHFCKNTLKTPSTSAYFPPLYTHLYTALRAHSTSHRLCRGPLCLTRIPSVPAAAPVPVALSLRPTCGHSRAEEEGAGRQAPTAQPQVQE